jgi:hypothetical protein
VKPEEAINAIKSNWPPENYTMLREALEFAVVAIKRSNEQANQITILKEKLIEEAAMAIFFRDMAIFFRDMADLKIDQKYYCIWDLEGEYRNEEAIREKYRRLAREQLKEEVKEVDWK